MRGAAAQMYDAALVRMRGTAAATNFALAGYRMELAEFLNVQQVTLDAEMCHVYSMFWLYAYSAQGQRPQAQVATRTAEATQPCLDVAKSLHSARSGALE